MRLGEDARPWVLGFGIKPSGSAVGDFYEGAPLEGPVGLADFKPGGRYFMYSAIGGALVVGALVIMLARR